jgi:drug/metabolite transporter (DMT)-like permease
MYGRYPTLLPAMLIVGGAAMWGLLWLPIRYMTQHGLNDAFSALAAFAWPTLVLLPMVWWHRKSISGHWRQCLVFGVLSGLAFGLYTVGLVYSSVIRVTLLFYLTPVWSALFAMLILKERTRWQGWLAAAVGLVGLALMLGSTGEDSVPLNRGDAFALISGIAWAFAVLVLRRYPDTPPLGTVTGQFLFAALCILVICLIEIDNAPWPTLDAWLLGAAVLGLFSCVLLLPGLFGIFWAAGRLPPARVGILMMSEVLVAVVSASLFTDEHLNIIEWVGASLIITAALLEVLAGERRHGPPIQGTDLEKP